MNAPRLLVFDSGVGGLSIARCLHGKMPGAELVYLADNGAFPYGGQPEKVVIERCRSLIGLALSEYPCDLVVVACNTASTVVLPELRASLKVPVVGVVPAIKPAAALSRNRRIGILATPATVQRPYLDELIRNFADDCLLTRVGHPQLVHWIEELVTGKPLPEAELGLALAAFRDSGVDTVVLGCTHYPLIAETLRRCLPEVLHWVDSGEAIARRAAHLLEPLGHGEVAPEPRSPVLAALFSGPVPEGLADFMAALDLSVAVTRAYWPPADSETNAAGSA